MVINEETCSSQVSEFSFNMSWGTDNFCLHLVVFCWTLPSAMLWSASHINTQFHFFVSKTEGESLQKNGIFGIVTIEYTPSRGYFEVVNAHDIATLNLIIWKWVQPATEVHIDDWATCRNIDCQINNISSHQVVVHRRHFMDPRTEVHTQEIESCWNNINSGKKKNTTGH